MFHGRDVVQTPILRFVDEFDGAHDAVDCQVAGAERHAQAAVNFSAPG